MPRYHFHVHNGADFPDTEGVELADFDAVKQRSIARTGELLKDNPGRFWNGDDWHMEVTDDSGLILFRLDFIVTLSASASRSSRFTDV